MQLTHPKVAQSKLGTFWPQVCYWFLFLAALLLKRMEGDWLPDDRLRGSEWWIFIQFLLRSYFMLETKVSLIHPYGLSLLAGPLVRIQCPLRADEYINLPNLSITSRMRHMAGLDKFFSLTPVAINIIIMSRWQSGFSWLPLSICSYRLSLLARLQNCILCPHKADVNKFLLITETLDHLCTGTHRKMSHEFVFGSSVMSC